MADSPDFVIALPSGTYLPQDGQLFVQFPGESIHAFDADTGMRINEVNQDLTLEMKAGPPALISPG